ncbi:hypothetical protein QBC37DRAFT_370192 [Rhypophila decipiens]|uniref:Uncharacterized protein n=1 Tax=Rhypophila decipiens TaxID=261697 RepID=A0AAN7BAW4_9PEZI|nr:hypothetical protein QBC37DRAFT_370192 [Rhypophila decipiens]
MCFQIDNIFACGHRGFAKYDYCVNFGKTCYGAGGNHQDRPVQEICRDCQMRKLDPNPNARLNDPYRQKAAASASNASTPNSSRR